VAETAEHAAAVGEEGREAAEEALAEMDAVEETTAETTAEVEALAEEVEEIGEVVDTISEIAEQTPARAERLDRGGSLRCRRRRLRGRRRGGEGAGRGDPKSASEIEARIHSVQERAETGADAMERTEQRISAGVETVETSIDALERLAEASERTDTSMTEITRATETQANSVDAVVGHVEDVSAISAQTASAAGDVTGAVDEQEQTLGAVETAAESLSDRARPRCAARWMTSSSRPTTASAPRLPRVRRSRPRRHHYRGLRRGFRWRDRRRLLRLFSRGEAPDRAGDNPADEGVDGAG